MPFIKVEKDRFDNLQKYIDKFIETAEKQKLESMVMDNPTYFYDILPFTYALGVSDKWIEKF